MKFMKRAFGEFHKFHMKGPRVLDSVYHTTLKNWILSPSKWTIFQEENASLTRTLSVTLRLGAKVSYDILTRRYPRHRVNYTDM